MTNLAHIRALAFDIDETISTGGKLTAEAFSALWLLRKKGFVLVPITGRPAGWCDHIARFWPVDAVVGENGAFTMFMQGGNRKTLETPKGPSAERHRAKLDELWVELKKRFPKAQQASDQNFRVWDLAIDIAEDVTPWPEQEVQSLVDLVHSAGARAKVSSIHVNLWFGDYTKAQGFAHWLAAGAPGASQKVELKDWIFIGDSPNDEPMFEYFKQSVGVANLKRYFKDLEHKPDFLTKAASGAGFCELALKLAASKARSPKRVPKLQKIRRKRSR